VENTASALSFCMVTLSPCPQRISFQSTLAALRKAKSYRRASEKLNTAREGVGEGQASCLWL
jgi:predicted metal-binding transcription factor (methanogenesis marker protein 9)